MKKRFLVFFAVFSLCASLFAQVSLDPNDPFYADAKNWETAGIVNWLPQIRPYSVQAVKKILNQVKENGSEEDIKKAEFYEKKYFSKGWNAGIEVGDKANLSNASDLTKNMFYVAPRVWGDIQIYSLVGLSYKLGLIIQKDGVTEQNVLPLYHTSLFDAGDDPFSFNSIIANWDLAGNLTFGKDNLYGMVGVNKIAYGPFIDDSVMLNGGQFHTGNFSFIYEGEKWGYSQVFSVLSRAKKNNLTGAADFAAEKFFAFQTIRWTPIKQVAVSYFDSAVYTNRFDPSYFLPIPYYVIQTTYANSDNWISGLTFDFRPVDRLGLSLCGLIDDVDLNSFAKGDFNARFKFALQCGINYTPSVKFIDNLSLDYTINMPYTYSHRDPSLNLEGVAVGSGYVAIADNYNHDNYTTRLSNLGTKLPPNSDRIQFKAKFTPTDRLRLDFSTTFVRHANIAEGFTDDEAKLYMKANYDIANAAGEDAANPHYLSTDGSIWTSSLTTPSRDRNNFLRQEHVMYVLQLGLNAEYELERMKWGSMVFNFGYMFEYIYNKGVDSDIYKTGVDNPTDADVAAAKAQWVANLRNVFNNYFSVSVKYYY